MEHKAMAGNVITAVATAAIMGLMAWGGGLINAGSASLDKDQIRAVLKEELRTDAGLTYGQALSAISTTQTTTLTEIGNLKDDVDDLEDAVLALASE